MSGPSYSFSFPSEQMASVRIEQTFLPLAVSEGGRMSCKTRRDERPFPSLLFPILVGFSVSFPLLSFSKRVCRRVAPFLFLPGDNDRTVFLLFFTRASLIPPPLPLLYGDRLSCNRCAARTSFPLLNYVQHSLFFTPAQAEHFHVHASRPSPRYI